MQLLKQAFCLQAVDRADPVLAECSRCHRAILEGISRAERRKVIGRYASLEIIEIVMNRKVRQKIFIIPSSKIKGAEQVEKEAS